MFYVQMICPFCRASSHHLGAPKQILSSLSVSQRPLDLMCLQRLKKELAHKKGEMFVSEYWVKTIKAINCHGSSY